MFGKLLGVFSLIVAVSCNELSILKSPKSVDFRGTTKVMSDSLADIFSAALGYSVETAHNDWDGLYVSDPFNLATGVVAVVVEGISESPIADVKTYDLEGSSSVDSLNEFLMDVMNHQKTGFHMDLKQSKPLVTPLGDLAQETGEIRTHYLKPKSNKEDRNVLEQISYINKLSEILSSTDEDDVPTAITVHVSLEALSSVHGPTSPAFVEAKKLLAEAIDNLAIATDKAYNGQAVIAVVATSGEVLRSKRQAPSVGPKVAPSNVPDGLNLATHYNESYPVIFNIILWFSVVMIFTLLAISYVIGAMDPGRDSIIYRMTSTRMKKEN